MHQVVLEYKAFLIPEAKAVKQMNALCNNEVFSWFIRMEKDLVVQINFLNWHLSN